MKQVRGNPLQPAPASPAAAVTGATGYLDKVEVARLLRLSPKTVGQWANQGKLPGHRIGGRLRFKWADIERWMEDTRIQNGELRMKKCLEPKPAPHPDPLPQGEGRGSARTIRE
jgi:excisionase family DNA binding protein